MPQTDPTDLIPADPAHPFANPTEEPDYSPDYRSIVPELDMQGSRLPLLPTLAEKNSIRRFVSLTCLILLFAFLIAASISTALTLGIRAVLQQIDGRAVGELPRNYSGIVSQYMDDSSLSIGITLLSFFIANLIAFRTGCALTHMKMKDFFHTHGVSLPRLLLYMLTGLQIQVVTGYIAEWVTAFLNKAGYSVYAAEITLQKNNLTQLALTALYTVVAAPITEELLMRGITQKNLSRVSQRFGILMTAFLFAVMHENLQQFLFTFPLGILLGYITVRHNSVLPAIVVHITVNLANMLMLCGETYLPAATMNTVEMIYTLGVLGLGSACAVYLFATQRLPDQTPYQSIRSLRVAMGSPVIWLLIAAHVGMAVLNVMI